MKKYSASDEGQIGLMDSGSNGSTDLVDHLLKSGSLTDKQIEYARPLPLMEDGIVNAADGITASDELLRSLPRLQNPRPMPELRRLIGDQL